VVVIGGQRRLSSAGNIVLQCRWSNACDIVLQRRWSNVTETAV